MIDIDEKKGSIRIVQELLFDVHVIPVIGRLNGYIKSKIENIDDKDDVNSIKKFLNTTNFTPEQVKSCIHEIADYYEYVNSISPHSIFEEDVIKTGVINWIDSEFNCGLRFRGIFI
jgi:hypothetical protein